MQTSITHTQTNATRNTRRNTREQSNSVELQVETTVETRKSPVIEPTHITPMQAAAKAAETQAAKDAKKAAEKAARERDMQCARKVAEATMTLNDCFRAVNAHLSERIHEDGTTVGSYLEENGLKKLTLKSLKALLPSEFVAEDGSVCMPTVKCATYDAGSPEDENNGKPVHYFVVKGKGAEARKVYKKAQTYGFSRIDLWTPQVLVRLLKAANTYESKREHYAQRNAEVKAAKKFFIVNGISESAVASKSACKSTRTTTYTQIAADNIVWAD